MSLRLLSLLLVLLSACAVPRGFDRGQLQARLGPDEVVTEDEIERVLDLKPQLSRPFQLGVFFMAPEFERWDVEWQWQAADKERFLDLAASLGAEVISEVVYVSAATAGEETIKDIRLAAARHGLDAVLVISGAGGTDRYNNAWGISYMALLTAFFVPGTVVDGLFIAHAGLWDVRNGFLYASVETDGTATETRSAYFTRESRVLGQAKTAALDALREEIVRRIQNLANRP